VDGLPGAEHDRIVGSNPEAVGYLAINDDDPADRHHGLGAAFR
jgi:hypothetical protein